jgi:hypothetical protein
MLHRNDIKLAARSKWRPAAFRHPGQSMNWKPALSRATTTDRRSMIFSPIVGRLLLASDQGVQFALWPSRFLSGLGSDQFLCCALFPGNSLTSICLLNSGLTSKCEGDMSGRLRAAMLILLSGLVLAACGSNGSLLGDAAPIPLDAVPLPRPAPKFSAAAPALPNWRHVPEPVSAQQFNQDKATCSKVAHNGAGVGPSEMKFYFAFTDSMHSVGYEAMSRL